jgi:hypothetical protein
MAELDCSVSPNGEFITLTLPDKNGESCKATLTFSQASSLAMTLPKLLTMVLQRKYLDGTLRHVYPLRGYTVEGASDYHHLMVALAADDGFEVVFALNVETAVALARDLAGSGSLLAKRRPIFRT